MGDALYDLMQVQKLLLLRYQDFLNFQKSDARWINLTILSKSLTYDEGSNEVFRSVLEGFTSDEL